LTDSVYKGRKTLLPKDTTPEEKLLRSFYSDKCCCETGCYAITASLAWGYVSRSITSQINSTISLLLGSHVVVGCDPKVFLSSKSRAYPGLTSGIC